MAGFEPATSHLAGERSIQLSYMYNLIAPAATNSAGRNFLRGYVIFSAFNKFYDSKGVWCRPGEYPVITHISCN